MLFPHESKGRIRALFSFAQLRLSWEHCPPANLWKGQLISISCVLSGRTTWLRDHVCLKSFKWRDGHYIIRIGFTLSNLVSLLCWALPLFYYYFPSSKFYICFFPSFLPLFACSFSFFHILEYTFCESEELYKFKGIFRRLRTERPKEDLSKSKKKTGS